MSEKIKTAILGYGRSGSTLHADPIANLPDFDLTAVCDIDAAARQKAFDRHGCRVYEDYHEMLAQEDLDLVVVVTRSDQHNEMSCDCLRVGKNVLVTKPWAANSTQAENMIATAKATGKMLLPWLPARWGCDLTRLKELIAAGTIGKVFQIRRAEYTFGCRNDWQTQRKYAGGYLLNWGPHLVDQPMQLAGAPVKSVYAQMRQIINPGDVEDVFFAVMKTMDDVIIVTEFNIASDKLPNWVVQGDRGTIYVRGNHIEIHRMSFPEPDAGGYRSRVEKEVIEETISGDCFGDNHEVYAHIARAVRGEEPYRVPLESTASLTRVMDAIRESSETGMTVTP